MRAEAASIPADEIRVAEAILSALKSSDPGAWVEHDSLESCVIDGRFDLLQAARAAIGALGETDD